MTIFLIILSCLLWALSVFLLFVRRTFAPAASYVALWVLSLAKSGPYPLLPINNTILIGWLCLTVLVMAATIIQNPVLLAERKGVPYMIVGGIVGVALGLLGFGSVTAMYSIMVIAVACGVFFAFLIFSNTPAGVNFSFRSGNFYRYLLANGFPIAVTLMMAGIPLVILVAGNS